MKTFEEFLREVPGSERGAGGGPDGGIGSVLLTLAGAVKAVDRAVRAAGVGDGKAGSANVYGEEQLALDVLSDKLIQDECRKNPGIGLIASEELPDEIVLGDGSMAVAYDPLDGSSLVDVNLAVGTIFGIYELGEVGVAGGVAGSPSFGVAGGVEGGVAGSVAGSVAAKTFIGARGDDQSASMVALYGPRTTLLVALKGVEGVYEFILAGGEFVLSRDGIKVGEGKMFAPGNLRACTENPKYLELTKYWINEKYKLRYSGGMAPDVCQILLKGKGIFAYPPDEEHTQGKLRLLFECAPLAFLMEKAGGRASDGSVRILEKKVEKIDQRTPIYIGSAAEVERCEKYLS